MAKRSSTSTTQRNVHGLTPAQIASKHAAFAKKFNTNAGFAAVRDIGNHDNPSYLRIPTGLMPLDIDLGGGFPAGTLSLVAGPYGVGKSRLLYRIARMHQAIYGSGASIFHAFTEFAPDHVFMRQCGVRIAVPEKTIRSLQEARARNRQPLLSKDEVNELRSQTGLYATVYSKNGDEVMDALLEAYESGIYNIIMCDSVSAINPKELQEQESLGDNLKRAAHASLSTNWSNKFLAASAGGTNPTTCIFTSQVRAADKGKLPAHMAAKARDWEVKGAEALKHAYQIMLILSDGEKIRVKSKKEGDVQVGKQLVWEIKKGKSGTHDGIRGKYDIYYDRDPAISDMESAIQEAFRTGVLVETKDGIAMFHGSDHTASDWAPVADRDALIEYLGDVEQELLLRQEILAAEQLQVLYRPV